MCSYYRGYIWFLVLTSKKTNIGLSDTENVIFRRIYNKFIILWGTNYCIYLYLISKYFIQGIWVLSCLKQQWNYLFQGNPRFCLTNSVIWLKALSRPSPVVAHVPYTWYGFWISANFINFSISMRESDVSMSCLLAMMITGIFFMSSKSNKLYNSLRANSIRSRSDESTT